MAHQHKRQLLLRALALLALSTAFVAAFTGRPAEAQGTVVSQPLDDTQVDFARGEFQRTSLSADLNSVSSSPVDNRGAVQLAPIGSLKPWTRIGEALPEARSDSAVVTIGNRLFVIAGNKLNGFADTVYHVAVNQELGTINTQNNPWVNSPLPAAAIVSGCPALISERTRAAAAALTTGTNTGFIYVVGGIVPDGPCQGGELTASGVQIGAVAANGTVTWSTSPNSLPSGPVGFTDANEPIDGGIRGVQMHTVNVVRTSAGKAFLYVIGGFSRYVTLLGDPLERIENTVFRAEINTTTGAIGAWVKDDNVPYFDPVPTDESNGIFDHVTVHVTSLADVNGTRVVKDGLVVAGGYTKLDESELNPFVYQAAIDPSTGDLTWATKASANNTEDVSLGAGGQGGMSGLAYNNKLYMIGGISANTGAPLTAVQTAVFNDNLKIERIPGSSEYFLGEDAAVLSEGRADAGAALMAAIPPANANNTSTEVIAQAWAFVAGGSTGSSSISNDIWVGKLGGDEAQENVRATDGYYYSKIYDVTFDNGGAKKNAKVLSINWAAQVDRSASNPNADIIVEFRRVLTANLQCANETVFTQAPDQNAVAWKVLPKTAGDFYSQSSTQQTPFNKVTLQQAFQSESFNATCFQYRVRFLQNGIDTASNTPIAGVGPAGIASTPRLFSMNIEKVAIGNADIRIPQNGFGYNVNAAGSMTSFTTVIRNLSLDGLDNTQDARTAQGEGGFYVHLCVAYAAPGAGAPTLTLPALPLQNGQKPECFKAFYQVYTWQVRAGSTFPLTRNVTNDGVQSWRREINNGTAEEAIDDIRTLFSTPGTYKVAMIIDAWNSINEDTTGEANNLGQESYSGNQPQVLTFEIKAGVSNQINLPMVRR